MHCTHDVLLPELAKEPTNLGFESGVDLVVGNVANQNGMPQRIIDNLHAPKLWGDEYRSQEVLLLPIRIRVSALLGGQASEDKRNKTADDQDDQAAENDPRLFDWIR
jgi:hypothetical protein